MTQPLHELIKDSVFIRCYNDHLELVSSYETVRFELKQQSDDNYYNIMFADKIIGGLRRDDGRITGKINLSDFTSYNTCLLIHLSRVQSTDCLLLQPIRSKAKYDPQKSNFITREEFNHALYTT